MKNLFLFTSAIVLIMHGSLASDMGENPDECIKPRKTSKTLPMKIRITSPSPGVVSPSPSPRNRKKSIGKPSPREETGESSISPRYIGQSSSDEASPRSDSSPMRARKSLLIMPGYEEIIPSGLDENEQSRSTPPRSRKISQENSRRFVFVDQDKQALEQILKTLPTSREEQKRESPRDLEPQRERKESLSSSELPFPQ